jgi:hypothetical protein
VQLLLTLVRTEVSVSASPTDRTVSEKNGSPNCRQSRSVMTSATASARRPASERAARLGT